MLVEKKLPVTEMAYILILFQCENFTIIPIHFSAVLESLRPGDKAGYPAEDRDYRSGGQGSGEGDDECGNA